jgi:propanol-preferring alcohol dehydrogenase
VGAHVSVDALGITQTCTDGILSLRKGGRHVQVGITSKADAGYIRIPTDLLVYKELKMIGSLGMPSHRFDAMLPMIVNKQLKPGKLVTREISLAEVQSIFEGMSNSTVNGTFVVTDFS